MPQSSLPLHSLRNPGAMEDEGGRRWDEMELDCLVVIFSKLGIDDLAVSVPFVCKSWRQASADPNCWRVLDFRHLDLKPSNPFAERFAAQYSITRFTFSCFLKFAVASSRRAAFELRFSPLFPASMEVLSLASKECPRLKALCLPRVSLDDEGRFLNLIANWGDLERLEMESKPSNLAEFAKQIGLHCTKFHALKLRGSMDREASMGIANSLPKLRFLDLSGSRLSMSDFLVIVNGCRELQRLSVKNCVGFAADDDAVKRTAAGVELFEHEGCVVRDDSAHRDDEGDALELKFMYYDDCFNMWML